ncbi:hypothetical protein MON38_00130 [Hymenobacter sp. DH14]|uniref:Uncharacterized protein n=1 Tax=Hymenobacter cyanobacteriorum TaxID=2926463 RepID=A0A9X1VB38_9BACT|nr:hypothetical protein [Hymenobacter cyanobacteriorum]MCI1185809.1 hypothetical protein [Hymenobacter cyanobacteriorum]
MNSTHCYSQSRTLRIIMGAALLLFQGCSDDACNGSIESVVLLSKSEPTYGGERIYVDVKNRGQIGVRKTLQCANGIVGTFDNVVVIRDFESRFTNRKKICFSDFMRMQPTDGAKMNDEGLPEIQLYH